MAKVKTQLDRQPLNFPIFIGSKSRLDFPMGQMFKGYDLFVEPQDAEAYASKYNDSAKINVLEKNDMGFGYLLDAMLEKAVNNNLEYWMFCDDDVLGFKTRVGQRCNTALDSIFNDGVKIAKNAGYAQLMISFSGHNWYEEKSIKECIGAWCCVINKTSELVDVGGYSNAIKIFNDWEMSARLIKAGKKTACWYDYCFEHKMKTRKGGAEKIYAEQRELRLAIRHLSMNYSGQVTIVEKHGQPEIRFNWRSLTSDESGD